MAALNRVRPLSRRTVSHANLKVKADAVLWGGGMVATDATGYAIPGAAATGLLSWGPSDDAIVDATGLASGALTVAARLSVPREEVFYNNDVGGTLVTQADMGKACYIKDDNTVTGASTGSSAAAKVAEVTSTGVWVWFT